jgi:hypothetical protein
VIELPALSMGLVTAAAAGFAAGFVVGVSGRLLIRVLAMGVLLAAVAVAISYFGGLL